jgi:hypothetical protein
VVLGTPMRFNCSGAEDNDRVRFAVDAEDTERVRFAVGGQDTDGFIRVVRRQPTHLLDGSHCLKLESAPNRGKIRMFGSTKTTQVPQCESLRSFVAATGNPSEETPSAN